MKNTYPQQTAFGTQLTVRLGALHLRHASALGELEGISIVENVLFIEGDFGDMAVHADTVQVERLA